MTVSAVSVPDKAPRRIALRVVIALVALMEIVVGLHAVALATNHMTHATPLFGFLIKARFMANVALALAGLGLAASGYIRSAVVALAAISVTGLFFSVPFFFAGGFTGKVSVALFSQPHLVAFPLMSAIAAILAVRDRGLWLAAMFLAIPALYSLFGIIMLAGVLTSM